MNRILKYINLTMFVFVLSMLIFVVVYKREDVKVGDGMIFHDVVIGDNVDIVDKEVLYSNYSLSLTKDLTLGNYFLCDLEANQVQMFEGELLKGTADSICSLIRQVLLGDKFTDYGNDICWEVL